MKAKIYIYILLAFNINFSYGQDGDVSLYTGQANIGVPIWTATSKDIAHPIGLSYSSAGVKVDAVAGKAGIGWHLNAGGLITRELRGLPDEYTATGSTARSGWLDGNHTTVGNKTFQGDSDFTNASDEAADWTTFNSMSLYGTTMIDTEPDIFHVNTAGLGLSFLFDNDGNIVTMPYQDVEIGYGLDSSGKIDSIGIIDSRGVHYNFELPVNSGVVASKISGADENLFSRDVDLFKDSINYHSIWHLTAISSPAGGKINFFYNDVPKYDASFSHDGSYYVSVPETSKDSVNYYVHDTGDKYKVDTLHTYHVTNARPMDLNSMIAEDVRISFEDALEYLPVQIIPKAEAEFFKDVTVLTPRPLLNQISIRGINGFSLDRKFILNYKHVKNNENQLLGKTHPFLESVTEHVNGYALPSYKFDYIGVNFESELAFMPKPNSIKKDFFGYFNNQGASAENDGLMKLYVYPDIHNADRYRFWPITGYSGTIHTLKGRDGSLNPNTITNGTISRVNLPSGGHISYYYEPNYFYDSLSGFDRYGGGIRVKKVVRHDGISFDNDIEKHYSYTSTGGTSSGKLLYRPQYAATRTYHWNTDSATLETYEQMLYSGIHAKTIWQKISVRSEDDMGRQNGPNVGYQKVTVSQPGLGRVEYDFDIFEDFTGTQSVANTRVARQAASSGSLISTDFAPIQSAHGYPYAPTPGVAHKRGLLVQSSIYAENDFLLEKTENFYNYLPQEHNVKALKVERWPYQREINTSGPSTFSIADAYVYSDYQITTSVSPIMDSTVNTKYNENNPGIQIVSSTFMEFDTTGDKIYLTKRTSQNAEGKQYITTYKYARDFVHNSTNPADVNLTAITKFQEKHMNHVPVETVSKVKLPGDSVKVMGVALSLFEYSNNDHVNLVETKTLRAPDGITNYENAHVLDTLGAVKFDTDSRLETVLVNETFDASNRAISSHDRAGNYVATLFDGTGKIPVGSVAGAKYSEVLFMDFENQNISSQDHELNLDDLVLFNADLLAEGRNGNKAYDMKSGNDYRLFKDDIDLADEDYLFSFWARDHTTPASGNTTLTITLTGSVTKTNSVIIPNNTVWNYYEIVLDSDTLIGLTDVKITSNKNIRLDDLVMHPISASLKHNQFNSQRQLLGETASGSSIYYAYDEFGRAKSTKEDEGNLVNINEYVTREPDTDLYIAALESSTVSTFQAYHSGLSNASYKWAVIQNIDKTLSYDPATYDYSGVTANNLGTFSYTFPVNNNTHYVYVKLTATGISPKYAKIQVRSADLHANEESFTLCVGGPVVYDRCEEQTSVMGRCSLPMQLSTGTVFFANLPNIGASSTTYTWNRIDAHLYDNGGQHSSLIETTTNSDDEYDIPKSVYGADDFYVWCTAVAYDSGSNVLARYTSNMQRIQIYNSQPTCSPAE